MLTYPRRDALSLTSELDTYAVLVAMTAPGLSSGRYTNLMA
jgi:hypothetical protein